MFSKDEFLNSTDDKLNYYLCEDVSKYNKFPTLLVTCLFDSSFNHIVFENQDDLNEVLDYLRVHGRLLER